MKLALVALLALAGCRPDVLRARPYDIHLPNGKAPSAPAPLVLVLHCYGCDVKTIERVLPFHALGDREGFVTVTPRGLVDSAGRPYWNATDGCCDLERRAPDDVAYLTRVIDDVEARYQIDRKRVYAAGFSNGGFMAMRLACDRADRIAAVVSASGAGWKDATRCRPSEPVAVLEAHGDRDDTIAYEGGTFTRPAGSGAPYPSAQQTIADWARRDGCGASETLPPVDVDPALDGAETSIVRYGGCRAGGAELWTIHGAGHSVDSRFVERFWRFLASHPKP